MADQRVVYIPEGFSGRLQGKPDQDKCFYAGGVHFCNIFIFSSGYRLSFSHCDPSVALEYIEKELRWVLEHDCTEVRAWRCSHGDIDPPEYADVWQRLRTKIDAEDVSKKVAFNFSEKVMYETASMSLADAEPKLHKIPNSEIAFPGAEPDLLRAVLKLNAYCTVSSDSFSPMRLLYEGGWKDLDKITEVTEDAQKMVTSDPRYEVFKFADRWVKECGAEKSMATDGVKDVFAYIDVYRKSKGLPPLKQTKTGVNEQCPCKNGKKFKKCHFMFHPKYLKF